MPVISGEVIQRNHFAVIHTDAGFLRMQRQVEFPGVFRLAEQEGKNAVLEISFYVRHFVRSPFHEYYTPPGAALQAIFVCRLTITPRQKRLLSDLM